MQHVRQVVVLAGKRIGALKQGAYVSSLRRHGGAAHAASQITVIRHDDVTAAAQHGGKIIHGERSSAHLNGCRSGLQVNSLRACCTTCLVIRAVVRLATACRVPICPEFQLDIKVVDAHAAITCAAACSQLHALPLTASKAIPRRRHIAIQVHSPAGAGFQAQRADVKATAQYQHAFVIEQGVEHISISVYRVATAQACHQAAPLRGNRAATQRSAQQASGLQYDASARGVHLSHVIYGKRAPLLANDGPGSGATVNRTRRHRIGPGQQVLGVINPGAPHGGIAITAQRQVGAVIGNSSTIIHHGAACYYQYSAAPGLQESTCPGIAGHIHAYATAAYQLQSTHIVAPTQRQGAGVDDGLHQRQRCVGFDAAGPSGDDAARPQCFAVGYGESAVVQYSATGVSIIAADGDGSAHLYGAATTQRGIQLAGGCIHHGVLHAAVHRHLLGHQQRTAQRLQVAHRGVRRQRTGVQLDAGQGCACLRIDGTCRHTVAAVDAVHAVINGRYGGTESRGVHLQYLTIVQHGSPRCLHHAALYQLHARRCCAGKAAGADFAVHVHQGCIYVHAFQRAHVNGAFQRQYAFRVIYFTLQFQGASLLHHDFRRSSCGDEVVKIIRRYLQRATHQAHGALAESIGTAYHQLATLDNGVAQVAVVRVNTQ